MARDNLRRLTVGSKKVRKRDTVTVEFESESAEFLLISPTVRERADIISRANKGGDEVELDSGLFQVLAVVYCTYDPESETKVFELGDIENLLDQPVGGFIDQLASPALKLVNTDGSKGMKEAEGNLPETETSKPGASSETD